MPSSTRAVAVAALACLLASACGFPWARSTEWEHRAEIAAQLRLPTSAAIEPFREPTVDLVDLGVVLGSASETPAGLTFVFTLRPELTYRLRVAGSVLAGGTTLRIRHDAEDPVYHAAPDGNEDFKLRGIEQLEVLLYHDGAFSYRIDALEVAACAQCKTDDDFRDELLATLPALTETLATDRLLAAELLLDWAANAADMAGSDEYRLPTNHLVSRNPPSDIYYDIFLPDKGGVYCGGFSVFYNKVLRLFDYPSFTINFGDLDGSLTHVTVIIPERQGNAYSYLIFDPTFNATFWHRASGARLGFGDLVQLARGGHENLVRIESRSVDQRDVLLLSKDRDSCRELRSEGDGYVVCSHPGYGIGTFLAAWEDRFVTYGYGAGQFGLFQLMSNRMFSVGPSPDEAARAGFLSLLAKLGIPLEDARSGELENL